MSVIQGPGVETAWVAELGTWGGLDVQVSVLGRGYYINTGLNGHAVSVAEPAGCLPSHCPHAAAGAITAKLEVQRPLP